MAERKVRVKATADRGVREAFDSMVDGSSRDLFAAHALQALIASVRPMAEGGDGCDPEVMAEEAYKHADAMMAERARRQVAGK